MTHCDCRASRRPGKLHNELHTENKAMQKVWGVEKHDYFRDRGVQHSMDITFRLGPPVRLIHFHHLDQVGLSMNHAKLVPLTWQARQVLCYSAKSSSTQRGNHNDCPEGKPDAANKESRYLGP